MTGNEFFGGPLTNGFGNSSNTFTVHELES